MASKIQVANFHDFNESNTANIASLGIWNMDGNFIINQLRDESFEKRIEILDQLIICVKRSCGSLPYQDHDSIFCGLDLALSDTHWEIRLKCIILLQELISCLRENVDQYVPALLNKLISNIGDSKVTIRKAVISCLYRLMKFTIDLPSTIDAFINFGLENESAVVRREMINALPMLLTKEFINMNLFGIVQSLATNLLDTANENSVRDVSLATMKCIEHRIGVEKFSMYVEKLSPALRNYYQQISAKFVTNLSFNESNNSEIIARQYYDIQLHDGLENEDVANFCVFGIVPHSIMAHINNKKDFKARAQAVEDLREVVMNLPPSKIISNLLPYMLPFLHFLTSLLDDSNFKILTVTLEIFFCIVEHLGDNISKYVQNIVSALSKRLGDNKLVFRQLVTKVLLKLMQCSSPALVLNIVLLNLFHRNSRVRQETINFIIAALLTFPSYEFDLANICMTVSPTLTDVKRQVRQAALECFAMLAMGLGTSHLQPLIRAVDQVELSSDGEGLMSAVQARLSRRQLPHLNSDTGLVEYATPVPSSASHRSSISNQSADTDWILAGGGTSARSSRASDLIDFDSSVSSTTRSTPGYSDYSSDSLGGPRRFMSAGRGRHKLPWEDGYTDISESLSNSAALLGSGNSNSSQLPHQQKNWTSYADRSSAQDTITTKHESENLNQLLHDGERTDRLPPRKTTDDSEWPVHLKATLARGTPVQCACSISKVPPITTSQLHSPTNDDDCGTAPSSSTQRSLNRNDSLNALRRSARNKVDDLFRKKFDNWEQSTPQSIASSSTHTSDSGICGLGSSTLSPPCVNQNHRKNRHVYNAASKMDKPVPLLDRQSSEFKDKRKLPRNLELEFTSSVLSRENCNNGIQAVGHGYSDEGHEADDFTLPCSIMVSAGMQESRQAHSGFTYSLSLSNNSSTPHPAPASQSVPGVSHCREEGVTSLPVTKMDSMTLVGHGMFDLPVTVPESVVLSEKTERRRYGRAEKGVLSGVVGVGMSTASGPGGDGHHLTHRPANDDSDDDAVVSLSKSWSFQRSIEDKQRLKREQGEQAARSANDLEGERRLRLHEEGIRLEKERQQLKLRNLGSSDSLSADSLSVSGSNSSSASNLSSANVQHAVPLLSRVASGGRMGKMTRDTGSSHSMPMKLTSLGTDVPTLEWRPISDPNAAIKVSLRKIDNDDWEVKTEGLNLIRRLVHFHANVFMPAILHPILLSVIKEVKNLRSQVSRLAISCVGDMFYSLRKAMDPDLDIVTRHLLAKAGESNHFIRDDVDRALSAMVEESTPQRALLALILAGASHRNTAVRKVTAQFLVSVVERMGPGKILCGVKDVTDRILPTVSQFVVDGSQETRYYGRKMLWLLMFHHDFDKCLSKYVTSGMLRTVQEVIDNLKVKGLGDKPSEATSSARSRRSCHGCRVESSTRRPSAPSSFGGYSMITPPAQKHGAHVDEGVHEEVRNMVNLLSASDWKSRYDGVSRFRDICLECPEIISVNTMKVLDKFLPRLQDSNSKVNVHALHVMLQCVPLLRDPLTSAITLAVSSVVPNLASKNSEIKQTATDILNSYLEHLDHPILIQPFSNQAQSSSGNCKAEMVCMVAHLTDCIYNRKRKQILLHVLPLLWHLLVCGGGVVSGELRDATKALVSALYTHMGNGLLDRANSEPSISPRHLNLLNELL